MQKTFEGKNILVTGGTGSIGSEIVRQVAKYKPKSITIFSRDEYKQFILSHGELQGYKIRFVVGDIRDKERLKDALDGIDIVFHAAALKQVPICEYNPYEAVLTNVIGTQNLIDISKQAGVEKFLLISTDKAALPTNVMGATKLLAERLATSAYYSQNIRKTKFCIVRFGNVLFSRGSVLELWKKQLESSNEITITEPDMTRFFMSIPEAVNLSLKALTIVKANETYILKMPVVKLGLLVQAFVEKYGNKSTKIKKIGIRPGEKMYEELMTQAEGCNAYELEDMFMVLPSIIPDKDIKLNYENIIAKKSSCMEYSSDKGKFATKEEVLMRI